MSSSCKKMRHSRCACAAILCLIGLPILTKAEGLKDKMAAEMSKHLTEKEDALRQQYQPISTDVDEADKVLNEYYIKNPSAKDDVQNKYKYTERPGTPQPARLDFDQVSASNALRTNLSNIIKIRESELDKKLKETKSEKDKEALSDGKKTEINAAYTDMQALIKQFEESLKQLVEKVEKDAEVTSQRQAQILDIVEWLTSVPVNEKTPGRVAQAVRAALSKAKPSFDVIKNENASPTAAPAPRSVPSPTSAPGAPVVSATPTISPEPAPATKPAPTEPSLSPNPVAADLTSDSEKELEERVEKLEHSLKNAARSGQDDSLLSKRLDSLESVVQSHDNVFALRAKASQEAELKASAIQNGHQIWMAALSAAVLLAAAVGVAALFKKGGAPQRSVASVMADQTARAGIQDLSNRLEALESSANKTRSEAQATPPAALATCEELAALSQRIDHQMSEFRSRLVADGEEVGRLRGLLVLDSRGRDRVVHGLNGAVASAKSVAEPFLASVERLLARLQLDSFRKVTRDRVEPQLLQDACAHIRATLDYAQRHADSLPAQVYVWEMARLQQVIESVKGVESDAAKAATLRTVLVRLLLSTYRSAGLREPMDKALDLAEDLKLLAPSDGPLRWTMECDGQGISADPADDRALWHLRGAKRAGNRTVLFPLVTENGAKLFAGVVTYEV